MCGIVVLLLLLLLLLQSFKYYIFLLNDIYMSDVSMAKCFPAESCSQVCELILGARCLRREMFEARDVSGPRCFQARDVSGPRCFRPEMVQAEMFQEMFKARDVSGPRCFRPEMFQVRDVSGPRCYRHELLPRCELFPMFPNL